MTTDRAALIPCVALRCTVGPGATGSPTTQTREQSSDGRVPPGRCCDVEGGIQPVGTLHWGRLPMPVSFAGRLAMGRPSVAHRCQRPSVSAGTRTGQFCHAITTARRILWGGISGRGWQSSVRHGQGSRSQNSILKLMAAALLAQGPTTLTGCPTSLDVTIMAEPLRRLGCEVVQDREAGTVVIDVPAAPGHRRLRPRAADAGVDLCARPAGGPRRASRCRALPGGDAIGSRGLDMHVNGLTRLGAEVSSEHGFLIAKAGQLHGASIWLDFPSVGATENLLTAAVLAKGTTVIDNAAREPEIIDICTMLVEMGATIDGIGSSTLEIEGVESPHR